MAQPPLPRTFAVLILLILSAGAGCLSRDDRDPSTEDPTYPVAFVVHGPSGLELPATSFHGEPPAFQQYIVDERGANEPTIAIAPDGNAFFAAFDHGSPTGGLSSYLYRSSDGQAWQEISPNVAGVPYSERGGDALAHVDAITGRLYFVVYTDTCLTVSFSDDAGETWTPTRVCDPAGFTDHPVIFSGPAPASTESLYPSATYLCYNTATIGRCQRSIDGGNLWAVVGHPFTQVADCQAAPGIFPWAFGFGAAGDSGEVYLPAGICGAPWVAVSHDYGESWQSSRVDSDHGMTPNRPDDHEGRIAVDLDGTISYFWLDEGSLPRYSLSVDQGTTWSASINITAPGVTAAKLPASAAGSPGRFAFQYIGTTVAGGFDATDEDMAEARWDAYYTMTLDAHAEQPVFATALMNPVADPLRRGPCDGRCIKDNGEPILFEGGPALGGGDGMFDYADLDVDPTTGYAVGAFVDLCDAGCAVDDEPGWVRGAVGWQVAGAKMLTDSRS